jgi:hypothetical protein
MICASLLLHFFSLQNAKSGMNMMKYAIVHPDHFSSPNSAFLIGFFCMWNIVAAEYLNIYVMLTFGEYEKLLASFITYRI